MEATIFTGWIYDHLKPHAAAVKVAHPLTLRAIAASKKIGSMPASSRTACAATFCRSGLWNAKNHGWLRRDHKVRRIAGPPLSVIHQPL